MRHALGFTTLACVMLSMACTVHAADAEVCYGPATTSQQVKPIDDTTAFTCPHAGKHTLPDLAHAGWIVVQVNPVVISNAKGAIPGTFADRLILRKD